MALLDINLEQDPTLAAIENLANERALNEPRRTYLGASSIGHECSRYLYYQFNQAPKTPSVYVPPGTLKRYADDGHHTEALVIKWLREIPGVQVWDRDPDTGGQIGGELLDGKFGYHVDFIIKGLLQAPATPHLGEVKSVTDKKFDEFKSKKTKHGEKETLQNWHPVFYAQAVCYMHLMDLKRHYLVVATHGGCKLDSCRTEANPEYAKALLSKAERIITATEPPPKLSENPSFFTCKMCDFREHCHNAT